MKRFRSEKSSVTMSATNRKYCSARMKSNNPMHKPLVREKVRTSLRAMGWKPPVRGGNGHGMTVHESLIACALGWAPVIYTTKAGTGSGYPNHYKIDVGNEKLKVAIEIDGPSHSSLKIKAWDLKKEEFLRSRGWSVLRFSNQEISGNLQKCVDAVMSTISRSKAPTPT